jgi:small subunit ribosomal protein S21
MSNLKGRSVTVVDGNVEKALRKFKKKVQAAGVLNDVRDREHYVKPTTERKLKRNAARKRWERQLASQQLPKKMY